MPTCCTDLSVITYLSISLIAYQTIYQSYQPIHLPSYLPAYPFTYWPTYCGGYRPIYRSSSIQVQYLFGGSGLNADFVHLSDHYRAPCQALETHQLVVQLLPSANQICEWKINRLQMSFPLKPPSTGDFDFPSLIMGSAEPVIGI